MKYLLTFALIVLSIAPGFAQHDHSGEPEDNWLQGMGLYNDGRLFHRFDRYSRTDIEKFKEKVPKVRGSFSNDPWEGSYSYDFPDSVTFSMLSWNPSGGFFGLSVYTCLPELRSLRYGRVEVSDDTVTFISEKANDVGRAVDKYVKVRWGHRQYLVQEESLAAFAEKAAGRYVEPEDTSSEEYHRWGNYWVKTDNENDPQPKGLPTLPHHYRHLERKPLTARVVAIGAREVKGEVEIGNTTMYDVAVYPVTIGGGSSSGFGPGMELVNPRNDDKVFLQTVTERSGKGVLVRSIDDDKQDNCYGADGERVKCPRLSRGQLLSTKVGNFWW